jgi:hypothetical protein
LHLALILLNNYCVTIRAKSFWHMSIGCKGDEARSVCVVRVYDPVPLFTVQERGRALACPNHAHSPHPRDLAHHPLPREIVTVAHNRGWHN